MTQGQRSMPVLTVTNIAETVAFFTEGLGFRLAGIQKEPDGSDKFAIVQMDHITLGLREQEDAQPSSGWSAYLYLKDISVFADHIQGNGIRIQRGPEDSFYHCTELEVKDPTGNILCFAQDHKPGADGSGL